MNYTNLLVEKADNIVTITLNRPEKSNAFDDTQLSEMIEALKMADRDADARAIVVTGAGKNFCAGQDLGPMLERYKSPAGIKFGDHLRKSYNILVSRIRNLEKPVIAAVNGAAAGAGLGLACACDLRYASEAARFRMAFIGIALAPDSGTSFFLPRLIGLGRATELAFTNDLIDAQTALSYGLVNRVFKADDLLPQTREIAKKLALMPTKSIGLTKRAFNRGLGGDIETALETEAFMQEIAGHTNDHLEGVNAFIAKRQPVLEEIRVDRHALKA